MGTLQDIFELHKGRLIHKWVHYFDIYERHFERFVGKKVNILEIGVFHGGSLQMWKQYFGDKATIYGLDINPHVKIFEEEQINILIGDQGNREFWRTIRPSLPQFDIIIDDGGHLMNQQIVTFEEMFPYLAPDGVFLIEDLHTSYWEEYGGAFNNPGTFIEYSKRLIDSLHAWYSRDPRLTKSAFTETAWSMSFYDSILAIEKRPKLPPFTEKRGH